MGVVLEGLGRVDDAADAYAEALRRGPPTVEAHVNLGAIFVQRGRLEEAASHFQAALRLRADDPRARRYLAMVKAMAKRRRPE
ncbi:MAG: tetratricopeptide repeat protein [Candidatus Omnitrophica bacterium]|nr:tetratricopeptide repeat protein [Candidatus Omnitrophota bacterium]